MFISVLGSASGFPTKGRYSPCIHISSVDANILLDCAEGAANHMTKLDIPVSKIDLVLISHMHADHHGGLSQLVQSWQIGQWEDYTPQGYNPTLIVPAEGKELLSSYLAACYLAPEIIQPMKLNFIGAEESTIPNICYNGGGVTVSTVSTGHLQRLKTRKPQLTELYPNLKFQSFSYCIEFTQEGKRVIYSGDLGSLGDLKPMLSSRADLLVVELAHFSDDTLLEFLSENRSLIGKTLINHIGPRYDEKDEEVLAKGAALGLHNIIFGRDRLVFEI